MSFLSRTDKRYSYHKRQPGPAGRRRACGVPSVFAPGENLGFGAIYLPQTKMKIGYHKKGHGIAVTFFVVREAGVEPARA